MKNNAKRKIFIHTIALMEEYPLDEITIKMICAYTGINRSTFYAYFQDKYDLIAQIEAYHKEKYLRALAFLHHHFDTIRHNNQKLLQFFRILFRYLYKYRRFFHAVFISHPQKNFMIEIIKLTNDSYEKVLTDYTDFDNQVYYIQYLIGGQLGVVFAWLRKNCIEPPEEMAYVMLKNIIKMRETEDPAL